MNLVPPKSPNQSANKPTPTRSSHLVDREVLEDQAGLFALWKYIVV